MTAQAYPGLGAPIDRTERRAAWRRYVPLAGAGGLIAVGYVDPGNWATDIAGGSRFGYALLSVVVASSLMAIFFQTLSARLGIATGQDLAEHCRRAAPRAAWPMWGAAEIAIVATDLAEVLGSALALQLLFKMPLALGVTLTVVDVGVLLLFERRERKWLERAVTSLMVLVALGFAYEFVLSRPALGPMLRGLLPPRGLLHDGPMIFTAVGILGATVMPHNLYLHSNLTRPSSQSVSRGDLARRAAAETATSLTVAMILNAALLAIAAAAFHARGHEEIADIGEAHRLLAPLLGSSLAPVVFALALLAAGQSATMTGTLAGQVVMTGFLGLRWPSWKRRLVTRACAILPALLLVGVKGDAAVGSILVGTQVILSLQLPLALTPLMRFTSDRARMGTFANGPWVRVVGWMAVGVVVAANVALLGSLVLGAS